MTVRDRSGNVVLEAILDLQGGVELAGLASGSYTVESTTTGGEVKKVAVSVLGSEVGRDLAFTGADSKRLALLALACLVSGTVMMRRNRRTRSRSGR